MRLLIDTHILVWLADEPSILAAGERSVLAAASSMVVSVVSLWELRLKWDRRHASGERKGPLDPVIALAWARRSNVSLLDLTPDLAVATLDPPLGHADPFDELLLTQAQQGGYRLLTRDRRLAAHPIALVA